MTETELIYKQETMSDVDFNSSLYEWLLKGVITLALFMEFKAE